MKSLPITDEFGYLGARQIAKTCQVSVRTAYHWLRTRRVPARAVQLVEAIHGGDLGIISSRWKGWRLRHAGLWSPGGMCFDPHEIERLPDTRERLRDQNFELMRYRALEAQYLKGFAGKVVHSEPPTSETPTPINKPAVADRIDAGVHRLAAATVTSTPSKG